MAIAIKYNLFKNDLDNKLINLASDTFKLVLGNTLPLVTWHHIASVTGQVANGNGYTTGGIALVTSLATSAGLDTLTANPLTVTASGGSIGPFRYYMVIDSTADSLMAYWDIGAAITLTAAQFQTFSWLSNVLYSGN